MGKLHKVRKAVEKNPAAFQKEGRAFGVSQICHNGKVVSYIGTKSYRLYMAKVLRRLGYKYAR